VWGAEWMFDHHPEAIDATYCLTELGGWSTVDDHGHRHVTVNVGEKGLNWRKLRVSGTPGHGSMPFGADNALVKAAEIVRRLSEHRPTPHLGETWRGLVDTMSVPAELRQALLDPATVFDTIAAMPTPVARTCHAMTHTTISPNVAQGGQKTNVIPDAVDIEVDIRTVPGTTKADVDAMLADALGDLADHVEIVDLQIGDPTQSPTDNALWDTISKHPGRLPRRVDRPRARRRRHRRPLLPPPWPGGLRRRAVLAEHGLRHVRQPLPRPRRAHRRREPGARHRLLGGHRPRHHRLIGHRRVRDHASPTKARMWNVIWSTS
jgi:hypothetical protein